MILHPGILALLAGSSVVLVLSIYASIVGMGIAIRWDFASSSEKQLQRERQTTLIATVMKYALGFEAGTVLLYLYTLDNIHGQFVGAMCATGSLNANPVGWWALYGKIALLFLSSFWVAVNHIDETAEDYPLVRFKCAVLPLITVLIGANLFLVIRYVLGLHPEIITSCCGSLFSEQGTGVASVVSSFPAGVMMWWFYGSAFFLFLSGLLCLRKRSGLYRAVFAGLAAFFFFAANAAVISFIAPYIYELPTHHCPFDLIQKEYHYIGYPLYVSFFAAVFFGMLPGAFSLFRTRASLARGIAQAERIWTVSALSGLALFILLSSWPVLFGNLSL